MCYLASLRIRPGRSARRAFTLVEMLVAIFIIGMLVALLLPALQLARASGRKAACSNNLRQIGVALLSMGSSNGKLCTGAFDWIEDGAVTEVGWVADLVNRETPAGELLCPSNPARLSEAYEQLLTADTSSFDTCLNRLGSVGTTAPDGTPILNPCRQIDTDGLAPGTEPRRLLVEQRIFERQYNTNYTASWFLVRTGVQLDDDGNLKPAVATCGVSLKSRNCTLGPLSLRDLDSARAPSSTIPLIGDGQIAGLLSQPIGQIPVGDPLVMSFTRGPVQKTTMDAPTFSAGTPKEGPAGWWAVWNREVLQDYRGFAPAHDNIANILFADGGVRAVQDTNGDGLFNNGFPANATTRFADDQVEIPSKTTMNLYSLYAKEL